MESSKSRSVVQSGRRTARMMLGIITLFIAGLLGLWWHFASDDPVLKIPSPVMPNPNAFDYYVAAGRKLVNTKQLDAATAVSPTVPMTLEQKEAVVQQNAAAIQSVHDGFAYEYMNPPARSFSALFPYFATDRRVARLLAVQSQVRAARGNWNGAAESALDAIRMGEDIPRGGVAIALLVGDACEAIGQRPMWETVEHLDAAQSRAAAQRLEAIMERHFAYADTIQEEKWMGLAGLQEVLHSVTLRNALSKADEMTGADRTNEQRYTMAFWMLYGKKRILQNYTTLMDATIAQAHQPYAAKLPLIPVPSDPVNEMLYPIFSNMRFTEVKAETQNALLLVALALHAYRLEHGRYPASLAELAPSYLKKIPADPFALQGFFPYRIEGAKYVLYSVGPDGKDDGGTPIDNPKNANPSNLKWRYHVEKESQGDIVSGINTR